MLVLRAHEGGSKVHYSVAVAGQPGIVLKAKALG